MPTSLLDIQNLSITIEKKSIVKNLSLTIRPGELHVMMGPNGSGKSSLAYALMGHPHYTVRATSLFFNGVDLKKKSPDERARLGLFLGFQYPLAISGISLSAILPEALAAHHTVATKPAAAKDADNPMVYPTLASKEAAERRAIHDDFRKNVAEHLASLALNEDMVYRNINEGFSGGEKKKAEVLQMLALKPKLAILDEPDSGLDVDALKLIAKSINRAHQSGMAILLITHYQRIVKYLKPDRVHIMHKGTLARSGGPKLIQTIEKKGYGALVA